MTVSGIAGYMVAQGEPRIVEPKPEEDIEAGARNTRLSADAAITWVYEYEMCRHRITKTTAAGDDLEGLTFSGLQQKYPEARITAFGADDATLELSFGCYCPNHYILRKDDDSLGLYRTVTGTDSQEKLREYRVNMRMLSEEENDELTIGSVFADREEVLAYVEKIRKRRNIEY